MKGPKEWREEGLCWPWCLEKFKHSKADLAVVKDKLFERNLTLQKLSELRKQEKLPRAAEVLLLGMLNRKERGELPWLIAFSPSVWTLQALATLAAVGYTLSTLGSCEVIDTAQIADLFFEKRSMFDSTPADNALHNIETAGFLVWGGINNEVKSALGQGGRFAGVLEYRLRYRLLTLFLAYEEGKTQGQVDAVLKKVASNLGNSVSALLSDGVGVVDIKLSAPQSGGRVRLEV